MSPQKCLFCLQFCQFLVIDNEGPGRNQLADLGFFTTCDTTNRESLICLPTSWSRVLLEKPTGSQLVKFPAFYGIRMLITAFTSARHLSLSWGSSIQFIPPLPTSCRSILPSTPGSPRWSFPLRFPHHKPVYAFPLPHTRYMPCPSHSFRFYHQNNIGWEGQMNRESQNI